MEVSQKIETLFIKGKKEFLNGRYYDAHETWEDLWSDYSLKDRKFVQGLIQLSVSFVHLKNNNMIGAKSLLKKSRAKFSDFEGVHRSISMNKLKNEMNKVEKVYQLLNNIENFDWSLVPKLDK